MAEKALVSYLRNALASGAEQNSLRIALLQRGYTPAQVEEAWREAQHIEVHHTIHFSPALIALLIAVVVAAGGFGYFIFSSGEQAKAAALLDLNLEPIQASAFPGEDLVVLKEVTNMGSAKGFDVELKTELVDPKTGAIIAQKTETRAVETIASTQTRIAIPSSAPAGEYILRTIAEYGGKRAVASIRVTVAQSPKSQKQTEDEALATENDQEENGNQVAQSERPKEENKCGNGIKDAEEAGIDCGGSCAPCQAQETIEQPPAGIKQSATLEDIRFIATTDPQKAMQECASQEIPDYRDSCFSNVAKVVKDANSCNPIINERIKDVCFSEVAKASLDPAKCDSISREDRRDSCYLTFVLDYKDYSVCEKIVNENLRQSCFALKGLT